MPTALTLTDLTAVSIDTTRGAGADAWEYEFASINDATVYGTIRDTNNSFSDGSTSGSALALKITISQVGSLPAIQDFDFLTITTNDVTDLKVWLPALSAEDVLYVDEDGNTWYDESLTSPAGGVSELDDSVTPSDELDVLTEFLSETITVSDAQTFEYSISLSDSVLLSDGFTGEVDTFTLYLDDIINIADNITDATEEFTVYLTDEIKVSEFLEIDFYGDFTEDTQSDFTWTEI